MIGGSNQLMKYVYVIVVAIILLLFLPLEVVQASPSSPSELVTDQMEEIDVQDIKLYWEEVMKEYGGFLPESQKGSFMEFVKGDKSFSLKEWSKGLIKYIFHELLANGKLLGSLILLTIFSMFLQNLQNAFEQKTVSKVAYAVVFMVLIIIALNSFHIVISYTQDAITAMTGFIIALVPLLIALIASSGGLVSAAFFHPIILF